MTFTTFTANPEASGQNLVPSQNVDAFAIRMHAKGSACCNSDVDVEVSFSGVWHVRTVPGTVTIPASGFIFNGMVSAGPPTPGMWIHQTTPLVVTSSQASIIFATLANSLTEIGIEHVPVPPAALLGLPGLLMVWRGYRKRARRREA